MCGDLNIEQTFGSLFLRMSGVDPTWNVSIAADDQFPVTQNISSLPKS
jgi:hypothetical protein